MTILSEGCMGAGAIFKPRAKPRRAQILELYQFVECQNRRLPEGSAGAPGGILGSGAQQGCRAELTALECPQGRFSLSAESRLYSRAASPRCSAGASTQPGRGSHALPRGPARPLEILAGDEPGSRSRAPRRLG